MIYEKLINEISKNLERVLSSYDISKKGLKYEITEPPRKEFGELSTNIAFALAREIKRNPIEIAKTITEKINSELLVLNNKRNLISHTSFEIPGFINFYVNDDIFLEEFFADIGKLTDLELYSKDEIKNDIQTLIEHTSVNPNKSLHVGHIRNAILGDCIYRILSNLGNKVKVLNYIDDSGLQVADIIVALKYGGFPYNIDEYSKLGYNKFDQYCGNNLYVKINELYQQRPDLEEKRKNVLRELEKPNSEIYRFTQHIVNKVLNDQLKTCWRLKCHYDILNFESQIVHSDLWTETFQILKDKKIISFEENGKNAGCWIYKSKNEGEKILIRSDNTLTYFAKDIPYALWKLGYISNPFTFEIFSIQWDSLNLYRSSLKDSQRNEGNEKLGNITEYKNINQVITIIDYRQERLQKILIEILSDIGIDNTKYRYLGYEPVILSNNSMKTLGLNQIGKKGTHMSGRKGIYIEADSALDQLEVKSREEVIKRNPDLSSDEIDRIAEEIAVSAIRYYFIKIDLEKIVTFDINESLKLEGDTGPYIQYTFARGNKILTKINQDEFINSIPISNILDTYSKIEIRLIKHLCKYSLQTISAAKSLDPKLIAKYLYELCTIFNLFYENSPIIKESNLELKSSRSVLLMASLKVMKHSMNLLGITSLERM